MVISITRVFLQPSIYTRTAAASFYVTMMGATHSISQATVGAASRSRRYCTVHSTTVQYYVNITLDLGDVTSWLG